MSTINGSFSSFSTARVYPYVTYSYTQSIVNNTSSVTVNLYFKSVSTYWGYGTATSVVTKAEASYNHGSVGFNISAGETDLIASHTFTVNHNTDGTKSIYIGSSGATGIEWGSWNFGATITLTTIPRRATITSGLSHTIGNNLIYTLLNAGSLYVKLNLYVWNGASYTLADTSNRGTGSGGTVTLGSTENNLMYGAMPSNTSRVAILRAYTYSDSGYSTQVGNYHDVNGTIYVNQTTNKPTFTTYTLENVDKTVDNDDKYATTLVSSDTSTLLGTSTDKMIKGISKIRAVVLTANKMVALNSATADYYRLVSGTSSDQENYHASNTVNLDIDNAPSGTVSLTAYDSRALYTSVGKTFGTIANYTVVTLGGLVLERTNRVDEEVTMTVAGNYFDEYFGGGSSGVDNDYHIAWRYKETTVNWGTQSWTDITASVTDTSGALAFSDTIEGDLGATGFDDEKSFNIEVRLYDKLTNVIIEGLLDRGVPVMDLTQDGVSFGARYDSDIEGIIQVNGTAGIYMSGSKFVIGYDDSGTMRYKYLDLSGTGVTWVHTTSKP